MSHLFISDATDLNSNSYVTPDEANDFFHSRYGFENWPVNQTEVKQLLVTATDRINREKFGSSKADELQNLKFPSLGETTYPQNLVLATIYQAYFYLREGLFQPDELHDLSQINSMSESSNGVQRSYSVKKIDTDPLAPAAKIELSLLPDDMLWTEVDSNTNQIRGISL